MAYTPQVIDHPQIPGAALVTAPDGSRFTVPKSALPPQLSLAARGATAQNMSMPEPAAPAMMSSAPQQTAQDFTQWDPAAQRPQSTQSPAPQSSAQNMSVAPPEPQQPNRSELNYTPAPEEQPQQAQQAVSPMRVGPIPLGGNRYQFPDGSVRVYTPGTAAYNPSRDAAQRVAVPVSRTTQTSGVTDFDPEAAKRIQEKEQLAYLKKLEAQQATYDNDLALQGAMATELDKVAQKQEAEYRAQEDSFKSRKAALEDDAKSVATKSVNPNRVFQNMSTWQKIGFALAGALSSYATKGQRNLPMEQLNAVIDRDVRAQELEIRQKGAQTDNALARLSQEWGSLQAGKAALQAQQREAAKQRLIYQGLEAGRPIQYIQNLAAFQALEAAQAKDLENARIASQGVSTQATQAAMASPRAATGGGFRQETMRERGERLDVDAKELGNAKKAKELSGEITGEELNKQLVDYGNQRAKVAGVQSSLGAVIDDFGIKKTEKGWVPTKDIPGYGTLGSAVPDRFASTEALNARKQMAFKVILPKVYDVMGAANTEQVKFVEQQIQNSTTEAELAASLGVMYDMVNAKMADLGGAYDPSVVRAFESRANRQTKISSGVSVRTPKVE